MSSERVFYTQGADGKMYVDDEERGYPEAPRGQSYIPVAGGRFIAVEPGQASESASQDASKRQYDALFQTPPDPKAVKQTLKRQEALKRQLDTLVRDMVTPGAGPEFETVTDEKYMDMMAEYNRAKAVGQEKDVDFRPLPTYADKILKIRPLYKGEVGALQMRDGTMKIVVLEQGFGEGQTIQVPDEIKVDEIEVVHHHPSGEVTEETITKE